MDPHRAWCLSCCIFLLAGVTGRADAPDDIKISAPAFGEGKPIPARYSYKHKNISPELRLANVPAGARSLVLIVDDPDSPSGLWTHWLVWNLSPKTTLLPEGKLPSDAIQGKNSFGHDCYDGPAPPSGTHHYFFHLYALDALLNLPGGSDREALDKVMIGHVIGQGVTMGLYSASP